jgi:hypothetical protein
MQIIARVIWPFSGGGHMATLVSFLDESSDGKRKICFCVGGFVTHSSVIERISKRWNERLRRDNISYFRFTDFTHLHGQFLRFRKEFGVDARKRADDLLRDLENIFLSVPWVGTGMGILMPDYDQFLSEMPASRLLFAPDPTESAYGQMIYQIARDAKNNAPGFDVAFSVDISSDYPKIAAAFQGVRDSHPVIGKSMATIAPLDDKLNPSIQMADLIVGRIRQEFARWRADPEYQLGMGWSEEWNARIGPIGIWNRAHMKRTVLNTLDRADRGKFAFREVKQPPIHRRRVEKKRRKELIKAALSRPLNLG